VEGIAVAQPSVTNAIVGISIAFLIFLFGIQPLGTQKISFFFAPGQFIVLLCLHVRHSR
jgi:KUP system potassium uptake protein